MIIPNTIYVSNSKVFNGNIGLTSTRMFDTSIIIMIYYLDIMRMHSPIAPGLTISAHTSTLVKDTAADL